MLIMETSACFASIHNTHKTLFRFAETVLMKRIASMTLQSTLHGFSLKQMQVISLVAQ